MQNTHAFIPLCLVSLSSLHSYRYFSISELVFFGLVFITVFIFHTFQFNSNVLRMNEECSCAQTNDFNWIVENFCVYFIFYFLLDFSLKRELDNNEVENIRNKSSYADIYLTSESEWSNLRLKSAIQFNIQLETLFLIY